MEILVFIQLIKEEKVLHKEEIKLFKNQPFFKEWLLELKGDLIKNGSFLDENEFFEYIPAINVIDSAFFWNLTKNGCDYWESVNKQWLLIIKEL